MKIAIQERDNFYQPPASTLSSLEVAVPSEERTPNGSFIALGPRRLFTGRMAWLALAKVLVAMSIHVLVSVGAGILSAILCSALIGLSLGLLVFAVLLFFLVSFYSDVPAAQHLLWRPGLNSESDFYVELTFIPRLPATLSERQDSADDIGIVSCADHALRYRGDRIEMHIESRDVHSLRRRKALWQTAWIIGPNLEMELEHPLLKRTKIRFGIREGFHTIRAIQRTRRMCRAIENWFRNAESR